ncbi:23S rRNA (uracil(1939)-C(5))-methyltransferase RlmD [Clostridium tetanomorphum]|uniref:23S rRNA (Uracil(1939)-C(5))-methyltransferase RlmD n=1 Tax=Clostridium tetanomorphum TaxID=1553 RepID=A0A923EAK6_CLOTT|nr:23S rRNA (uracil(1939)-C(5))-methyltransferase RlmD [Clostridium tetanomorphum]MBC2399692.1 23S rRNA (uracil(1939)-C(5))-methyltransferase RlmD [Clostridium tetanomorphum]NRZ98575.1 tRNA (uracil-5-)-methyltransferase [Clostridium tetanomorphum]
MKKGKEYEFNIESMEFPSMGIANSEGLKVYIKNALPGQKVLARISKKKKDYAEGKLLKVIEDIDYKREVKCSAFGQCGGCVHQDVPYEKQLELKKEQVLKLFKEAELEGFEFLGIEGSPEEFEYRNKMEFTFGDMEKGGELTLGMHAKGKSFGIITVDCCQIVDKDYRIILSTVLNYFRNKNLPHYRVMSHEGYLRNLVIRKASNTGEILINFVTTSQIEFNFEEITEELRNLDYVGNLVGIIHTINDSLSDVVQADKIELLYGRDYIIEELLGLKFKITPFSFFQTNSKGAEKLYSIVRQFIGEAKSKTVFDLYCGTGTIGQIVAPEAKKVIGIELIEEAVKSANENAKLNGLDNCTFIAGDVAKIIGTINEKPDLIILDPPRPGVHPVALDYVIKFNAPDIIYVSCNPKTLVTDLKVLVENGYTIEKVKVKDMFPHTPHVETVVKIVRK